MRFHSTITSRTAPKPANGEASAPGRNKFLRDLAILAALWLAAVLVVGVRGDFPLNDDWSFAQCVQRLVQQGDFRPSPWTAMTLLTQVLWGALFCIPAGFSFTALRCSTLCLGLVAVLGTYLVMREVKASRTMAIVAALALAFNPVFFALSFTFMTDVPFLALAVLMLLFFLRALRDDSTTALAVATLLAVAAILQRQLGLFIPLAFVPAYLRRYGWSRRAIVRSLLPSAAALIALLSYMIVLRSTGRLPDLVASPGGMFAAATKHPRGFLWHLGWNTGVATVYLGLFLAPCFLVARGWLRSVGTATRFAAVAVGVVIGLAVWWFWPLRGGYMPLGMNVLHPAGIGPLTLADVIAQHLHHEPLLPRWFWCVVTNIAVAGAAVLLAWFTATGLGLIAGMRDLRSDFRAAGLLFLFLAAVAYCVPVLPITMFDRYLLPLVPTLACAVALSSTRKENPWQRWLAAPLLLVPMALFSIAATHDYLRCNAVRWEALNQLTADEGIPPTEIDGGLEFNGWYLYGPNATEHPGKSWYWVVDDRYMMAYEPMPGYEVLREYDYGRWLPPRQSRLYLLRRPENPQQPPASKTPPESSRDGQAADSRQP